MWNDFDKNVINNNGIGASICLSFKVENRFCL